MHDDAPAQRPLRPQIVDLVRIKKEIIQNQRRVLLAESSVTV